MSKVIILMGSPRKGGNTDLLAESFAAGVGEDAEIIRVTEHQIAPCIGCNACFAREENRCIQQDDMALIYQRLAKAEVLAIASPVYFYGLSAQCKAVIDRLHTPMRNRFPIKKLALLLVAGAELPAVFDAVELQYRLSLDFFGLQDAGRVLVRGVREKGDIRNTGSLDEAFRLGRSLRLGIS